LLLKVTVLQVAVWPLSSVTVWGIVVTPGGVPFVLHENPAQNTTPRSNAISTRCLTREV
jgi:hypothetical protein